MSLPTSDGILQRQRKKVVLITLWEDLNISDLWGSLSELLESWDEEPETTLLELENDLDWLLKIGVMIFVDAAITLPRKSNSLRAPIVIMR